MPDPDVALVADLITAIRRAQEAQLSGRWLLSTASVDLIDAVIKALSNHSEILRVEREIARKVS